MHPDVWLADRVGGADPVDHHPLATIDGVTAIDQLEDQAE
jgi:hypothetical protein